MGTALAGALVGHGWDVVTCLRGRPPRTRAAAQAAGVTAAATLVEAVATSDLVVSVVPQPAVLPTAEAFAAAVRGTGRRPVYLDANSVAPATMAKVHEVVASVDCACVDGALVGSADLLGEKTRLYLSGSRAEDVATTLGDALRVAVLGSEVGLASAFKLAFAGFNKGLVALFLEVVMAVDRGGRRDELLECLRAFYPGSVETVERLLPSYPRHAARRVEEIDELAEWLVSVDQRGAMALGTKDVLARFVALGLDAQGSWNAEQVLEACSRSGFLADVRREP